MLENTKARDCTYIHPLPAEINAIVIRTLTKSGEDFHPACWNAIVNGDEAIFDVALRSCGESEEQMMPWKNIIPI